MPGMDTKRFCPACRPIKCDRVVSLSPCIARPGSLQKHGAAAAHTMMPSRTTVRTMPTPPKTASPVVAKPKPKPKKPAEPAAKPFLRFCHSAPLRAKTLKVLEAVEGADKPTTHSGQITDLILELTDAGMDQFFLQSLKATKANFVVQQSASLGLAGVQKVMGTVIRNIVGRMDDKQLLSVCGSIRQFMV